MRLRAILVASALAAGTFGGFAGCSGPPEGDLPQTKPVTQAESDEMAKKVDAGRTGYKGAPGIGFPKGAR